MLNHRHFRLPARVHKMSDVSAGILTDDAWRPSTRAETSLDGLLITLWIILIMRFIIWVEISFPYCGFTPNIFNTRVFRNTAWNTPNMFMKHISRRLYAKNRAWQCGRVSSSLNTFTKQRFERVFCECFFSSGFTLLSVYHSKLFMNGFFYRLILIAVAGTYSKHFFLLCTFSVKTV